MSLKAYCLKLKETVEVKNATIDKTYSRGAYRYMLRGTDPSGQHKITKFMGAAEANSAVEAGLAKKGTWE